MLFAAKELFSGAVSVATTSAQMPLLQNTLLGLQCVYTVTTGSYALQAQESIDGVNWTNVGSSQAVTATGSVVFKISDACSPLYRVNITKTSGNIDFLSINAYAKGV